MLFVRQLPLLKARFRRMGFASMMAGSLAAFTAALPSTADSFGKGVVRGLVVDKNGDPVEYATVTLERPGTKFKKTAQTKRDGQYRFTGVPSGGPYVVTARRLGFQASTYGDVMVTDDEETWIDLALDKVGTILPDVTVRRKGSRQTWPFITKAELDSNPTPTAFTALFHLRPSVFKDICNTTDLDLCRYFLCLKKFDPNTQLRAQAQIECEPTRPKYYKQAITGRTRSESNGGGREKDIDAKNSKMCDPPRLVFIDGIRKDITGEPLDKVLDRIAQEDIEEIRYIDCWADDVPARYRNSIWVRIIDMRFKKSAK